MRLALLLLVACKDEHVYALEDLPVEAWTGGLPVEGDGRLIVWLAQPDAPRWTNAVGFVRFRCDDCRLGDGIAKLQVSGLEDVTDGGLAFPGLDLGSVTAAAAFAGGHVTLTTTWRSDDFVLDAKVRGDLAPAAEDIVLRGCVRFRASDALRARDPKMHAIAVTTGAPLAADGAFTIELAGTLGNMRRLPRVCELEQVR